LELAMNGKVLKTVAIMRTRGYPSFSRSALDSWRQKDPLFKQRLKTYQKLLEKERTQNAKIIGNRLARHELRRSGPDMGYSREELARSLVPLIHKAERLAMSRKNKDQLRALAEYGRLFSMRACLLGFNLDGRAANGNGGKRPHAGAADDAKDNTLSLAELARICHIQDEARKEGGLEQ